MILLNLSCEGLECEQDQNLHLQTASLSTALFTPSTYLLTNFL